MEQYRRGDLVFDVLDRGPADGPVVILLHGFPQRNDCWDAVIGRLAAGGYRCLAPNQRGYSPGARPKRRRDYRLPELVDDVAALIEASGAERVHLVGHDWGAAVAWAVAGQYPERLITLAPLSVPHPAAFTRAVLTSRQVLSSWYMAFFQLPRIPEWMLVGRFGRLAQALQSTGQNPAAAKRDAAAMAEPGALTGALNWYRGMPLSDFRQANRSITVPTMYVWSDHDTYLAAKGAKNSGRYVSAEYRFEVLAGLSHWLMEEQPDTVADLLLDWFAAHPA